jgi:hypothetical protein
MPRLLDPTGTVAIIVGAYDWTRAGLGRAPSFRRSAAHYQNYLLAAQPSGLGIQPDRVLNLFDDPSPASDQLDRIHDHITDLVCEAKETDRRVRDVLIYYVGHGSYDHESLCLLVRHSSMGREEQSSLSVSHLARELRLSAPQQRRIVILDCCFSEAAVAAFGAQSPMDEAIAATAVKDLEPGVPPPERGVLLFCSSPRNSVSFGRPDDERTLFTGALLSVLQEGSASRGEMLTFSDLRDDVYDRMILQFKGTPPRPALHQPDQQAGDLARSPAFPNPAWDRREAEIEQRAAEVRRKAEIAQRAAEARRKAGEEQRAAEARRKAGEEQRAAEVRRKAGEEQRAAEVRRKAEEEQRAAEVQRKAEIEQRASEVQRKRAITKQRQGRFRKTLGATVILLVIIVIATVWSVGTSFQIVSSGVDTPISVVHFFNDPNRNCAPGGQRVDLLSQPSYGRATTRDEWTVIPEMGPRGPRPCAGVRTLGKQIYYQSNPGYRGLDRVIFEHSYAGYTYRGAIRILVY